MNNNNVQEVMIWCIVAIVVIVLIYVIVSLIMDHVAETKKTKELMSNLEPVSATNNGSFRNQDVMQMPVNNQNGDQFYASVGRFTDTGRSMTQSQYNGMNTTYYDDVQFVIVKSLIYTETREEID